jgi:septal ring factor EnvC (AmiA/AmiB activator)
MAGRVAASQAKLDKIREMRRTMKALADEARERNDYFQQLAGEYERLPKDVQRTQYTERIMEIVRNVKKQNLEIERVRPCPTRTPHTHSERERVRARMDACMCVYVLSPSLSHSLRGCT